MVCEKEWYDVRSAAERKGVNYNSLKSRLEHQPNGGIPDALLMGKKVWHRDTIKEWLSVTDDVLDDYLARLREEN